MSFVSENQDDVILQPLPKKQKTLCSVHDLAIISTSNEYTVKINKQISRYFYATNTPFNHADHEEFKKMCSMLRPGYKGPSAYQIGGPILDTVYEEIKEECREKIKDQVVCMSLDGWSNVHNEPIVCCSIVTANGESILVNTVDTGVSSHTATNLKDIALTAMKLAEKDFQVKVRSFVTDNAANVQKMRNNLMDETNILQYGCSAHFLNLLAQDLDLPAVTQSIIRVIKYFRNKHIPAALYKEAGGKKLVMPQEVRWNTMHDAIRCYLDNRGILIQLCQDRREAFDSDIRKVINDNHVTMNAVDLLARMTPIAVALDRMQRTTTTISIAVEIWNTLESALKDQPLEVKKHFFRRRSMAMGGAHFAANMLDHRFLGKRLNNVQKEQAYQFINEINPQFLPFVMALITQSKPFPKYMYGEHFRKTMPLVWWKSLTIDGNDWPSEKEKFLELCEQLLTANAATAALERYFSSFGLVQSKLRNRLGCQKTAKLVFLFKYLNEATGAQDHNLDRFWEIAPAPETVYSSSSDDEPLISFKK